MKAMEGMATVDGHGTCDAKTRSGGTCNKPAGWGTPLTRGRCSLHGGNTPTQLVAVRRAEAVEAVARFGLPREVDPHQALTEELHRSAGWVAWLEDQVRADGADALATTAFGENRAFTVTSPYYELLGVERKRMAEVAQACIRTGVEEAQMRLVEQSAQQCAAVVRALVGRLGLKLDDPAVRSAIESTLRELPTGEGL